MKKEATMTHKILALTLVAALLLPASAATAGGGSISGTLTFKGKAPKAIKMPITKDNETCGTGQRVVEEVRLAKGGGLEDVAVFISGKIAGHPPKADGFELVQKGCRFNPFVSAVHKKAKLKIVNGDPVAHNIHGYELMGRARRDLFNFQQPTEGHVKVQKMKTKRGEIVQLQCDIHDFMKGWIIVPQNPFAAVSSGGKYSLSGVPDGEYTVKAFHPVLGTLEQKVTVAGGAASANFEFKAK
jgi:plastocyanin